jgi:hypothetical protein
MSVLAGLLLMGTACAILPEPASNVPPSRLSQYLGRQIAMGPPAEDLLPEVPVRAGLVLLADTTAPGAAPVFGDEALGQMAESLRSQLAKALRLNIDQVLPADGIRPDGGAAQFVALGQRYQYDYLLIAVASSTEQEYPFTVFLGWTSHSQPGLRRDNWSLVETALLDVKTGIVLLRAEGRGWATLDRPTAAGINQWYPVIWKRPQEPNWRWWPPSYESAPHTLRVIAMQDAVKRLVIHMQDAWIQKRQQELDRTG